MTTDPAEIIARAIFESETPRYFDDGSLVTWDSAVINAHAGRLTRVRKHAAAALAALREAGYEVVPTPTSWDAGL